MSEAMLDPTREVSYARPRPSTRVSSYVFDPSAELEVQFEVRDRLQLEIRFNHTLADAPGAQIFRVDTYFFIPKNIGVNASNYSKDQFYGDVTALMRLDAAPLPLKQLADPTLPASPLFRLARALERFQDMAQTPPASEPLAIHVKLYAYLHTEAVRREIRELKEMLKSTSVGDRAEAAREEFQRALDQVLADIRESLRVYRRLRTALWPFEKMCHQSMVEAARLADEYMSLFLEERLAALSAAVESDARRFDGSCFVQRTKAAIGSLAREEAEHRKKYGFLTLSSEAGSPEYFTYRSSLVKKAIHQALYLDAREVRRDTYVRNAIGGVGAALAAIWALATQLPATIAGLENSTKLVFFGFAVMAYVMKDRIKVLTNEYLTRKLRKYDHSSKIYGKSLETIGLGMIHARLEEQMTFLAYHSVRENIRRIRLERRTVRQIEAASNEEVIYYRKALFVEAADEKEPMPQGYGFRDILRLNFRHFLVRLDDPSEKLRYYDSDRECFSEAKLPKIYHFHVVVRVRRISESGQTLERFDHMRVVLNKNGIVRVERLG